MRRPLRQVPPTAHTCSHRAGSSPGWLVLARLEPVTVDCWLEPLVPLPGPPGNSPAQVVLQTGSLVHWPDPAPPGRDEDRSQTTAGLSLLTNHPGNPVAA